MATLNVHKQSLVEKKKMSKHEAKLEKSKTEDAKKQVESEEEFKDELRRLNEANTKAIKLHHKEVSHVEKEHAKK